MQGLDIILGDILIILGLVISLIVMVMIREKKPEKAAKRRVKWLSKRLKTFNLSYCWRWHYRLGYRRGKKRGIEIGREQGQQHIEVVNRCRLHAANLEPQWVQLADGRWVQGWFCPCWPAHTLAQETVAHPFAAKRFTEQLQYRRQATGMIDTQEVPIVKAPLKKIKLS
jgi:hypothetical protein